MKKNDLSSWPVVITGFSAVILQCVIIREFLTVFSGNELILGIVFSVWLLSASIGSFAGHVLKRWNSIVYTILLSAAACLSFLGIRYFPTLFTPGRVVPTSALVLLFVLAETPISLLTGYIFGCLARQTNNSHQIYGLENIGTLAGTLVVFCSTLFNTSNALLLTFACAPLPLIIIGGIQHKTRTTVTTAMLSWICIGIICSIIMQTDTRTGGWKYAGPVTNIRYTREGELATLCHGNDTTVMLNNMVYRSTINKSMIEQAVHIPAAQRNNNKNALVIFDQGQYRELQKYPDLHCDILETLPEIASLQSMLKTPEQYRTDKKYDLLFIGASIPYTAAISRFYTVAFFDKMKGLMINNGVLSFTLPYNENFMPKNERTLHTILRNTLHATFPFVLVFPGNGYATFMASGDSLHVPETLRVPTEYLASYVLPALTNEKIGAVNQSPGIGMINNAGRPIALYVSLKTWMQEFGFSATILFSILAVIFILGTIILPHTAEVFSIATSGLSVGFYSIALMLLYQTTYGDLYAEIALLLMALSLGFVAGSWVRRFLWSDVILGAYVLASFLALSLMQQPPVFLFLIAHFGIGMLSAAQFVTRKNSATGILNSADLFGGVFGMALSSTVLVPLFGILPVAGGVLIIKLCAGVFEYRR